MQLLTALNEILPKLGEHPVTSVTDKSPTLSVVIPEINAQRRNVLTHGYWFNRFDTELFPDLNSEIALPLNTLAFQAECYRAVVRGPKLFNGDTLSYLWDTSVKGVVTLDIPFEELPESAAQLVLYTAMITAYGTDIGLDPVLQLWQGHATQAALQVQKEHLRNMKYTTQRSPRYARLWAALRG